MHGSLLLLPNILGKCTDYTLFLPKSIDIAVSKIDGLIAENPHKGRCFLQKFKCKKRPHDIPIASFNKHSSNTDIDFLLEPLLQGECWGFVTDSGLPCIADPGSKLVYKARKSNINVQAFVGPSSIMLGLMLSGLPGQNFYFHGYLNKRADIREKHLQQMEKESKKQQTTHIFIETPHRNIHILKSLLKVLNEKTYLCIASDLTLPSEEVITMPIKKWRNQILDNQNWNNKTSLFLFTNMTNISNSN